MLHVCLKHQSLLRKLNSLWALLGLFFLFGWFCGGFWLSVVWWFWFCFVCGVFCLFFLRQKANCLRKQTQLSQNHLWFSNRERWQAKLCLVFFLLSQAKCLTTTLNHVFTWLLQNDMWQKAKSICNHLPILLLDLINAVWAYIPLLAYFGELPTTVKSESSREETMKGNI